MTLKTNQALPCDSFADRLVDLSDEELAAIERQPVLHHLATCERCRAHLALLNASRSLLVNAIDANHVRQPPKPNHTPSDQRSPAFKMALATAALILLALSTAWLTTTKPSRPALTAQPTPPTFAAPHKLTEAEALWQITLLEEQARLKTSLEYLPQSPAFADQRQKNEQILTHYKSLLSSTDLQ